MRIFFLLSIVLISLILTGCTNKQQNDLLQQQNDLLQQQTAHFKRENNLLQQQNDLLQQIIDKTKLTTRNTDSTFEKKQECAKFINNEKTWLYDFTIMNYNDRGNYVNKYGEIGIEKSKSEILEIFYSKKINSCVSIIKIAYRIDMGWGFRYIIRDLFNNINIGDYFDWNYYNALVLENGDGEYDFGGAVNYPLECNKESETKHCKKYNKRIQELKG